ncbi:hypothetical protein K502DRAFT_317659 [Neoconidiobolus thromboides FSU 785]|nr:hypothetical protein K502DRAFT_317659 [Neoconidiobolus thromboides FSU 785]
MPINWNTLPIDLTNGFLSLIIDIFFRDIEARGSHYIPKEGPVFFVAAPHANQFLDPLVLNRHSGRRIYYLIAKKSYDRPLIGDLAKLTGSIPVARAQDYAKEGKGKLRILERYNNPLLITGTDSKFTQDLHAGDQIVLKHCKGGVEVVEVLSDTEIKIKKEFSDANALIGLTSKDGADYTIIPHLDHSIVYKAVHETLDNNGCVGIFPEGGSHDRTQLLPLKAGIAIMSLGAMAANPDLNVKIIPCGMNYFHPDRFRSRAVVEYGQPITISKEMVEQFKKGGLEKRQAGTKLLSEISDALKNVTLNTPDYETLKIVQAARRLYRSNGAKLKISQVVQLNRRLVEGYLHFKDEPRIQDLKQEIMEYNELLKTFGIRDHQVKSTQMNRFRATLRFFRRVIVLSFFSFVALPGAILNAPIFITAHYVSKKKQKEALAASTVKVAARDVISSWKLLIALGLGPTLYGFYAFMAFIISGNYNFTLTQRILYSVTTFVAVPFISYISLLFGERGLDIYRSLPPLFHNMIGNTGIKEVQEIREDLSQKITELVNDLGPQLFPDLDRYRIVVPDNEQPRSGTLTPTTQSALNWFMSPFELMSERLFSDNDASDSSASVSRSNSHPNLTTLTNNQPPLSPLSPKINSQSTPELTASDNKNRPSHLDISALSNLNENPNNEIDASMIIVEPPTPSPKLPEESKKIR